MTELRRLPRVDDLAASEALRAYPPKVRVSAAREAIALLREKVKGGEAAGVSQAESLASEIAARSSRPSLRPAINLSGIILHTGLGRARLAEAAARQIEAVARSHSAVELDLEEGKRGDRQEHVRVLLRELTGAEDAHVVNNAAAGVLLALTALCAGREVVLSRGQMVEIGGSFRMPEIVEQSGCRLVEVGCTNKTRLSDYERAIGEDTAAVLRCHPSNFKIVGFTAEPEVGELARLCRELGVLLIDDQGSGSLIDLSALGLAPHPTLTSSVAGGADVSVASGDKLLGGPQAGMIVGRAELLERIRRHPLARAVRIDKLTLAGLEATLRLYASGQEQAIPTLRYLSRPLDEVRRLARALAATFPGARVEQGVTEVGGGSAPGDSVPTWRVGLPSQDADELLGELRRGDPPIIGRIERGLVWLDPRTLEADEAKAVQGALRRLGGAA